MADKTRPEKLGPQTRSFKIRAVKVDTNARTATLSFSSEEPCDMWYGTEVLSHAKGAMRTGDRQDNMPLLFNHDMDDLLGIVESVSIDDKRGQANVRFGKDDRGDWAMKQVDDGILVNSSFMYRVYKWEVDEDLDPNLITATEWEPYEISLVTVPADPTVGVGRSQFISEAVAARVARETENTVSLISKRNIGDTSMPPDTNAAPAASNGAAPSNAGHVDVENIRREAGQRALEGERARQGEIAALALRFGLDQAFVEQHRTAGSTVEVVQRAALDAVEKQQRDGESIRAKEATRVSEIEAISRKHNLGQEFVRKHVEGKTTIELVRGMALEVLEARGGPAKPLADSGVIDWSRREAQNYSVRKAILAVINNDWTDAGFEREVSQTIAKERSLSPRAAAAFFMPTNMPFQVKGAPRSAMLDGLNQRAIYQVGTPAQGGNLVGTELLASDFIEVLRNRTVTGQLGARYLPGLTENIDLPRQNAQTSTFWVGESVGLTESEATFDKVSLRPHTVGALSKMSRLTLLQTTPAIEQLVREDLMIVEALAVDAGALFGTGSSSQPTGITNTSGIGSVVGGTNGASATFDMMVQLYTAALVANAPQANLAYAINAKTKGFLATLKSTTGQYLWNPTQSIAGGIPNDLVGYQYAVSNQLPSNLTKGTATAIASMAIFGNWQELLIGEWGVTEIMVNPYDSTGFANGDVIIRVFQTVDVGLRHPASFSAISDMLTPGF